MPATQTGWRNVIIKRATNPFGLVYALHGNTPTAGPGAFIVAGGFQHNATSPTRVPLDGQWHHLAATYNGTVLRVFVDGVQRASFNVTATIGASTLPLMIGGDAAFFTGLIDEVRVYNRALTATQIQNDMVTPIP
jgi:hypothetical protein